MQIEKYIGVILVQSNFLGRWWGNVQTIAQHSNIYIQFLILAFSATSAYVGISATLHAWGYQLAFWQFILGVLLSIVLLGLFVWRLSIPSTFATWNEQFWKHNNKMRPILEQMQVDDADVKERLDRIERMLQQLIQERNESDRTDEVYSQKG